MLLEVQVLDWLHLITAKKETRQIRGIGRVPNFLC
jgi:hypothetical protein